MIGTIVSLTIAGVMILVVTQFIMPQMLEAFSCPSISGDLNGDYVEDPGEKWTDDSATNEWSLSCNNMKTQVSFVSYLFPVVMVGAAFVFIRNMGFGFDFDWGHDDEFESKTLPVGTYTKDGRKVVRPGHKRKGTKDKLKWFLH